MFLKPKNTNLNPRGLLYKRFTALQTSENVLNLYKTSDNKYWSFDADTLAFNEVTTVPTTTEITTITSTTVLTYSKYYAYYTTTWNITTTLDTTGYSLLSAKFNNIGKYQTNKYYFVGSFDFVFKGSFDGATGQYIKGNITPLTSVNIMTTSDTVKLNPDDLVAVGGNLYSIENVEISQKKMPKPFNIYHATLNNIL